MKMVQHPNVVRLYEVIDTATKLYLILELGDGGDMYDCIMKHDGGLSEEVSGLRGRRRKNEGEGDVYGVMTVAVSVLVQGRQVLLRPNCPRHFLLPPAARGPQGPEAGERGVLRETRRGQADRLRLQQPLSAGEDPQHVLWLAGLLRSRNPAGRRVRCPRRR